MARREPIDGDGDGYVYDETPRQRLALPRSVTRLMSKVKLPTAQKMTAPKKDGTNPFADLGKVSPELQAYREAKAAEEARAAKRWAETYPNDYVPEGAVDTSGYETLTPEQSLKNEEKWLPFTGKVAYVSYEEEGFDWDERVRDLPPEQVAAVGRAAMQKMSPEGREELARVGGRIGELLAANEWDPAIDRVLMPGGLSTSTEIYREPPEWMLEGVREYEAKAREASAPGYVETGWGGKAGELSEEQLDNVKGLRRRLMAQDEISPDDQRKIDVLSDVLKGKSDMPDFAIFTFLADMIREERQKQVDATAAAFGDGTVADGYAHNLDEAFAVLGASVMAQAISSWAGDSNRFGVIPLERGVADEFGVPYTPNPRLSEAVKSDTDALYEASPEAWRTAARRIYDRTQAVLKAQGIDDALVYRGVGNAQTGPFDSPLTSWSVSPNVAAQFTSDKKYQTRVPAERIFAGPMTGLGKSEEAEVVLLPGDGAVAEVPAYGKGQPRMFDTWLDIDEDTDDPLSTSQPQSGAELRAQRMVAPKKDKGPKVIDGITVPERGQVVAGGGSLPPAQRYVVTSVKTDKNGETYVYLKVFGWEDALSSAGKKAFAVQLEQFRPGFENRERDFRDNRAAFRAVPSQPDADKKLLPVPPGWERLPAGYARLYLKVDDGQLDDVTKNGVTTDKMMGGVDPARPVVATTTVPESGAWVEFYVDKSNLVAEDGGDVEAALADGRPVRSSRGLRPMEILTRSLKPGEGDAAPQVDLVKQTDEAGGFTFDPNKGEFATSGTAVAVSGYSAIIKHDEWVKPGVAKQFIADYLKKMRADGVDDSFYIGGWYDKEHDEVVLDRVQVFANREDGIKAGRERGEQAVFDLAALEEIPTGGTGGRENYDIAGADPEGGVPTPGGQGLERPDGRGDRPDGGDARGQGQRDGGQAGPVTSPAAVDLATVTRPGKPFRWKDTTSAGNTVWVTADVSAGTVKKRLNAVKDVLKQELPQLRGRDFTIDYWTDWDQYREAVTPGPNGYPLARWEPENNRIVISPSIAQRLFFADSTGSTDMRTVMHELVHAASPRTGPNSGPEPVLEEAMAEILSLDIANRRIADFGRTTDLDGDSGLRLLAKNVAYPDRVASVILNAASEVGWNRDAVMGKLREWWDSGEYAPHFRRFEYRNDGRDAATALTERRAEINKRYDDLVARLPQYADQYERERTFMLDDLEANPPGVSWEAEARQRWDEQVAAARAAGVDVEAIPHDYTSLKDWYESRSREEASVIDTTASSLVYWLLGGDVPAASGGTAVGETVTL